MTNLLIRLFIKNHSDVQNPAVRAAYGNLAGVAGMTSNMLLFALKLIAGLLSGSISIMADAVNNLSDGLSSVITLIGFKLSARPSDAEHPFGHARYEYISGLAVSIFILVIGFQFLTSSIEKIITPEPVEFSILTVTVLVVSILIKAWQGLFNRNIGRRIQSETLRATAEDSRNDVIITSVVLLGAIIGRLTGLHIDGWAGFAVAIFILVSGVRLVLDTLNPLIGAAPDHALIEKLEKRILHYPSVIAVHDLIIHSYGPGHQYATAHVEMPAEQDMMTSHDIVDRMEREISEEMRISLVTHVDPVVVGNEQLDTYRRKTESILEDIDARLALHDFRILTAEKYKEFLFDIVIPENFPMDEDALRNACDQRVKQELGDSYRCNVRIDRNYTIQ